MTLPRLEIETEVQMCRQWEGLHTGVKIWIKLKLKYAAGGSAKHQENLLCGWEGGNLNQLWAKKGSMW